MTKSKSNTITVESTKITIFQHGKNDFISLTDMAKGRPGVGTPKDHIRNWMRNRNTVEFLGLWESIHNPNFKGVEFDTFRKQAGLNSFNLTPKLWTESTDAIGIISKSGKNGGTYAHKDIAFEFGVWISPKFKILLIKEFQRLKEIEYSQLKQQWDYSRFLAKANYKIHTDAIKDVLVPISTLPDPMKGIVYADEAELLNVALFDRTSKDWRESNPEKAKKGENIRDYATVAQLTVLANLESYNAILVRKNVSAEDRLKELRNLAITQLKTISSSQYALGPDEQELPRLAE